MNRRHNRQRCGGCHGQVACVLSAIAGGLGAGRRSFTSFVSYVLVLYVNIRPKIELTITQLERPYYAVIDAVYG